MIPILIWQYRKGIAQKIMRDENISQEKAFKKLSDILDVDNVYKKLDQVDKL